MVNRISLAFDQSGTPCLFDLYNKKLIIINKGFEGIKSIVPIADFHKLYSSGKKNTGAVYSINVLFERNNNVTIAREISSYIRKTPEYFSLNRSTGQLTKEDLSDTFSGERSVITRDRAAIKKVSSFIKTYKNNNPGFIEYSADKKNENEIFIVFLCKKKIEVYTFDINRKTFSPIKTLPHQIISNKDMNLQNNYIRAFSSSGRLFLFVKRGKKFFKIKGRPYYKTVDKLVIYDYDKDTVKTIPAKLFRHYTVYHGNIYTWDCWNNTREFNVYRLEPKINDVE